MIAGRYLQTLGVISILNMIMGLVFFDRLFFDFTAIIFFWAGYYLIRPSPTARSWTLVICTFNLVIVLLTILIAIFAGTDNMTLTVGQTLHEPPVEYVILIAIGLAILPAIPTWLLMTPEAKIEFGADQSE